jgi:hypothetical protein
VNVVTYLLLIKLLRSPKMYQFGQGMEAKGMGVEVETI